MPTPERPSQSPAQAPITPQSAPESPLVTEMAEMVEGKVSELTPKASKKASGQQGGATQQKKDDSAHTSQLTDREALRKRLLENAPTENVMKREIIVELEKQMEKIEGDIRTYRKKKQYHLLSKAVMQLRRVARQIESLARAGVDQLKDVWLKVVKRFA